MGSSRNRDMRHRPAGWTGSVPDLGGCKWSQLVRLCSRCREVVPMHVGALCGGRADRHRAEGCGWRVARHGEGAVEQYERKACNNHMSRTARPRTPYPGCCTPWPRHRAQMQPMHPCFDLRRLRSRHVSDRDILRFLRYDSGDSATIHRVDLLGT